MKKLVEAVLENLSTKDVFLFRVTCGKCGKEYGNKPIRFSKAEMPPTTQSKQIIYDALYEQEFKEARRIAIRNAAEHMNFCPICKRLVCNQCFLICDDLDMCKQCAADLEQQVCPSAETGKCLHNVRQHTDHNKQSSVPVSGSFPYPETILEFFRLRFFPQRWRR